MLLVCLNIIILTEYNVKNYIINFLKLETIEINFVVILRN